MFCLKTKIILCSKILGKKHLSAPMTSSTKASPLTAAIYKIKNRKYTIQCSMVLLYHLKLRRETWVRTHFCSLHSRPRYKRSKGPRSRTDQIRNRFHKSWLFRMLNLILKNFGRYKVKATVFSRLNLKYRNLMQILETRGMARE